MAEELYEFYKVLISENSRDVKIFLILLVALLAVSFLRRIFHFVKYRQLSRELSQFYSYRDLRKATNNFLNLCVQGVAPDEEFEPGLSNRYIVRRKIVPFFLNEHFKSDTKYCLVLADAGMGKTSFLLNLYIKYNLRIVPNKYKVKFLPFRYQNFEEILKGIDVKEKTILLLDGFDEDIKSNDNIDARFDDIVKMTRDFKYVVITSRAQYFTSENAKAYALNISRNDEKGYHVMPKLYLSPLSDKEIYRFLVKKYGIFKFWNRTKKRKVKALIKRLPEVAARPAFLAYMDSYLFFEDQTKYSFQLYERMVQLWIERGLVNIHANARKGYMENMELFLINLSIHVYENRTKKHGPGVIGKELEIIGRKSNLDVEILKLSNLSFIHMDSLGNWKFSNKSILEFFLAKAVFNNNEFKGDFDFKGFDNVKLFYEEMVECFKKEFKGNEPLSIYEVFGVRSKLIASYHERVEIDKKFVAALNLDKHIIIYGSSKQGKTSLFKKHLSETKYITINCSANYEVINIYRSILRQNDILISESINTEEGHAGSLSSSIKAKIKLPVSEMQSDMINSEINENRKAVKYKTVDFDIDKAQDIIEILKSVGFQKRIIIENFHYLSEHTQNVLAFDLRNFQDEGIYFIILGIWRESNRLCQYNRDLLERICEIPVEPWKREDLIKVIKKGAGLLRVNMDEIIENLIDASYDSIGVLQELCKEACINAQSDKSPGIIPITEIHLRNAIKNKLNEYSNSHIRSLEAFSTVDDYYHLIPFFFIKTLLTLNNKEIEKGINRIYFEEKIVKCLDDRQQEHVQSITKFLKEIKDYQLSRRITPPLFGYSLDLGKVYIIDSTLYFFLKHCEGDKILAEIEP
jgi:hypothetical protein